MTTTDETNGQSTRLQFGFSDRSLARLDALQERTDAVSRAQVIRDALQAYEWLAGHVARGTKFTITEPGCDPRDIEIMWPL